MLMVRKSTYRDYPGFSVFGEGMRIFFREEGQARTFVKRYKQGEGSWEILTDIWNIGRAKHPPLRKEVTP